MVEAGDPQGELLKACLRVGGAEQLLPVVLCRQPGPFQATVADALGCTCVPVSPLLFICIR